MSSEDNPGDLVTRNISKHALLSSSLWWQGPIWLPHQNLRSTNVERAEGVTMDYFPLNVGSTLSLPVPVTHLAISSWDGMAIMRSHGML